MKRLFATLLVWVGTATVACYTDDTLTHPAAIAPTKVYITDDPFPFDKVSSVNIYVTKIEANPVLDTNGTGANWVTIATPNKSFELLTLQQGDSAFVGQSAIDAGEYSTIRMTIDVDRSSIKYSGDTNAVVHWPGTGHGEVSFYAGVQPQPLPVAATGATLVIDFDVGSTFVYNNGTHDFTVTFGALRAVNSAVAGAIAGHVGRPENGSTVPVPNADVSVFLGGSLPVATGRTDSNGVFRVGFLPAGSYAVQVQQPDLPLFASVTRPGVTVTAGATSNVDILLSFADSGANYVAMTGPDSVSTFGSVVLHASVVDSNHLVPNPIVTWVSRNPSIAIVAPDTPAVVDSVANEIVSGLSVGTTWIVAMSGAVADSLLMLVYNPPPPPAGVATVTLDPTGYPSLAVNDSVYFKATLRDSSGNVVSGAVVWSFAPGQDSTVVDLFGFGLQALIRARRSGSTIVRATEPNHNAHADASVLVH